MRVRRAMRKLVRLVSPPKPRPMILMYHRIAELQHDYWGLAVSPSRFEEQLHVLRRTRYPLPLHEFVDHLAAGTLRRDAVAITFDDGYVDNLFEGKPRLAAADIPGTVFLATGYLDRAEEFWWDELTSLVLLGKTAEDFDLPIGDQRIHVRLGAYAAEQYQNREKPSPREAILMNIWEALRQAEDQERRSAMTTLRSALTSDRSIGERGRPMTRPEVSRLASDGLVSIGAHTVTHALLPELRPDDRDQEINGSKSVCEAILGAPVAGFSYPYGKFSSEARDAVRSAGFAFACSSRYRPVHAEDDAFELPRINIYNSDGDTFERTLRSACELN